MRYAFFCFLGHLHSYPNKLAVVNGVVSQLRQVSFVEKYCHTNTREYAYHAGCGDDWAWRQGWLRVDKALRPVNGGLPYLQDYCSHL
jgi:hypothetical protein